MPPTSSPTTAAGPMPSSSGIRGSSTSSRVSRRRAISGSAAPTAACRPTRSSGCCPASSSSTATWPTSSSTTDLNCLSVLQYAVDVLQVEHVIVCGHYGCGGVEVAWKGTAKGLIDNWLRHVQDVADQHRALFTRAMSEAQSTDRLAELNVLEQVTNVCADDDRARRVAARPAAHRARLDLRAAGRPAARSRVVGDARGGPHGRLRARRRLAVDCRGDLAGDSMTRSGPWPRVTRGRCSEAARR